MYRHFYLLKLDIYGLAFTFLVPIVVHLGTDMNEPDLGLSIN